MDDNWEQRSADIGCDNCMWFVGKRQRQMREGDFFKIGRCRCGDHKLDENKV